MSWRGRPRVVRVAYTVPVPSPPHLRNTLLLATVEIGWGFALAFIQPDAILPVLVHELGGSWLVIAMLPALMATASLPFELASGVITPGLARKKGVVYVGHCVSVLFPLGLGVWFWIRGEHGAPRGSLGTLYGTYFVLFASIGFLYPVWYDFMGKIVDPARRGRAFALIFTFQTLAGMVGAQAAKALLSRELPFPRNYALCFMAAGVIAMFANQAFLLTVEQDGPVPAPAGPRSRCAALREALAGLRELLADPHLRRYLAVRAVTRFWPLVGSFYAVQATSRIGIAHTGDLATAFLGGKLLGNVALASGDRIGFRPLIALGIAGLGAAAGLLAAQDLLGLYDLVGAWPYYLAAVLAGAFVAVDQGGNASFLLATAPPGKAATAIALSGAVVWLPTVAAAATAGFLADHVGPERVQAPFAVVFVVVASYLQFAWGVPEPSARATA